MAARHKKPDPRTALFLDETARRDALQSRAAAADGHFVYGVRTTGVFCRPSCPSRPAKPENVTFFATSGEAEAAGYRACKRCRPTAAQGFDPQAAAIATACAVIEGADSAPSLAELAAAVGLSPFHFHRLFKSTTGITPKAYVDARRAERVRTFLTTGTGITAALYDAGYGSSSRFYEKAQGRLGMTASAYRRGGEGMEITVAVGACSLGAILVAATARGICAIALGDDPDALLRDVQERFPKALFTGGDKAFETVVAGVIGAVEMPARAAELPLDVRGTAFQERVWQALRAIPSGETATYAELAGRIGAPTATRAVARACAANPVAVAIPCHRIIRTDGGLGGYRWGIERKQTLIDRERSGRGGRRDGE